MPLPNPSIAFALFDERSRAEEAIGALRDSGLGADQVELTGPDDGPSGGAAERGIVSSVKTPRLGGSRAGKQLYQQLVELGIEENEARYFRDQVLRGKTLVTVISMRREREAANLLRQYGGLGAFEAEAETSMAGGQAQLIREDIASANAVDDVRSQ